MSVFETVPEVTDKALASFDEIAATQKVRLFDVYALGPMLIYAATRKHALGPWSKRALFISGVMTIIYNWDKYRTIKADLQKAATNVQIGI